MEEKKTLFDYLAQVMVIFGFTMLVLYSFSLIFGNEAKDVSSIFRLGKRGISAQTAFQFLSVSALLTGARFLFFTDVLIKKMKIWLRTTCMLASAVLLIAVFAAAFRWFPVHMWQAWVMFAVCFGVSFLGSCFVAAVREKAENKRMEEALRRLKEKK